MPIYSRVLIILPYAYENIQCDWYRSQKLVIFFCQLHLIKNSLKLFVNNADATFLRNRNKTKQL